MCSNIRELNPATARSACINDKEKQNGKKSEESEKRKGSGHRVKHPALYRATDALMAGEEQNGEQKRTKRKKQGADHKPSYPGPFSCLLNNTQVTSSVI